MTTTAGARAAIAAALDGIDGVQGLPYPPQVPSRGQGWPEWQNSTPDVLVGGATHTFQVHVALPAGLVAGSDERADELIDQVFDALEGLGAVSLLEPRTLILQQAGAQALPLITATIEL